MARSSIPTALAMRRLKYEEAPDAEREQAAKALRSAGRRAEALLLYERHPDAAVMAQEKRWAVEQGNSFHLLSIQRMGTEVSADDLKACAEAAQRKARWRDAMQCLRSLEDADGVARVRAILDKEEGRGLASDQAAGEPVAGEPAAGDPASQA